MKNTERINRLLQEYESRQSAAEEMPEPAVPEPDMANAESGESILMPSETEQKLLRQLREFEESVLFTDRNMSLPFLAAHLGTNIKYISHIINRYKEKDFNNYINELRINYIIRQLREDPKFRKYKIATLAEESGFSSANKFTTIFKKVTEVPPSVFIKHIRDISVSEVSEC